MIIGHMFDSWGAFHGKCAYKYSIVCFENIIALNPSSVEVVWVGGVTLPLSHGNRLDSALESGDTFSICGISFQQVTTVIWILAQFHGNPSQEYSLINEV